MKEWFEEWFDSPYYHLLYQHRSDDEANTFVSNLTNMLKPVPRATLLDLACGKGRHARAFAEFNLDVTGVDLSPQSIEAASTYEHEYLHFFTHDMRHPFRSNYFDVICNLFTSFGYFKSQHDHMLAARHIYNGLKKEGTFVFDFVNQSHARRNIDQNQHEVIERGQVIFTIERSYTEHQLRKKINIHDGIDKGSFTETVNSFSLQQITDLFTATGLKLEQTFGDYNLGNYHADTSPRMILIFRK